MDNRSSRGRVLSLGHPQCMKLVSEFMSLINVARALTTFSCLFTGFFLRRAVLAGLGELRGGPGDEGLDRLQYWAVFLNIRSI